MLGLFSAPVKSADIKIEVTDPSTGKVVSTYEKTYTSKERGQIQDGLDQKRSVEEVNRQTEDMEKKRVEQDTRGMRNQVELERRRLAERLGKVRSATMPPTPDGRSHPADAINAYERNRASKAKAIEDKIAELERDPEFYFYKESQENGGQGQQSKTIRQPDTKSRHDFLPSTGKYRWEVER